MMRVEMSQRPRTSAEVGISEVGIGDGFVKTVTMSGGLPKEGIEPSLPCGNGILNPARLPIPPLRLAGQYLTVTVRKRKYIRQARSRRGLPLLVSGRSLEHPPRFLPQFRTGVRLSGGLGGL